MKVLGTGATASLAGCAGNDGSGSTEEPDTPGSGGETTAADEEDATEGTASDSAEDDIIATQPIWPTTLDPLFYFNETITEEGNYVLEQVPALATDYEFLNDENTEVRFFLREGVTFHNGDEFTPEDVVFSFKRELDPEASDIEAPGATALPTYDDIAVVDDEFAVDLTLTNASPKRWTGSPAVRSS